MKQLLQMLSLIAIGVTSGTTPIILNKVVNDVSQNKDNQDLAATFNLIKITRFGSIQSHLSANKLITFGFGNADLQLFDATDLANPNLYTLKSAYFLHEIVPLTENTFIAYQEGSVDNKPQLFDISNIAAPVITDLNFDFTVNNMIAISNTKLIIFGDKNGQGVINYADITDIQNPVITGLNLSFNSFKQIKIINDHSVLLTDKDDNLFFLDVTDATNPNLVNINLKTQSLEKSLLLNNKILIVSDLNQNLVAVDYTNQTATTLTSEKLNSGISNNLIKIDDNTIAFVGLTEGQQPISNVVYLDVTNPSSTRQTIISNFANIVELANYGNNGLLIHQNDGNNLNTISFLNTADLSNVTQDNITFNVSTDTAINTVNNSAILLLDSFQNTWYMYNQ